MADEKMRCAFGDNCDEKTLVLLKECKKDTAAHLRYLKCNTEDIIIPESVLIRNRAGDMGLGLSSLYQHVCAYHRNIFGLYWKRTKRTCCHPLHHNNQSSMIARGLNIVQSREIWLKLNLVLPIGSGVCRRCIETHKKEISMGVDLKEELKEMCTLLEKSANESNNTEQRDSNVEQMEVTVTESTCILPIVSGNDAVVDQNFETEVSLSQVTDSASGNDAVVDQNFESEVSLSQVTDSDFEFISSQSTSASNWSKDERTQRELFNQAMDILSSGDYPPLKCQVSQKLDQLQYSTKKYYIRQARLAIELVCESIAPCQGRDLMHQVFDSIPKEKPKQSDAITETVISAYMKAEDHTTKVQILSIIVGQYTKSELLSLVEGLTLYKIDAARKYAATHGPGQYITPPKITRVRIPKEKIHHFIQFISSPAYLQVVGFGSRHLKLSSGLSVKIPKVIRTMIASRLITAYDTYCKENSIIPPSRATLYKIIKACPASQLKSLHGLDNYISDGMDGIDTLKKLISSLAMKGLSESKVAEIQKMMETLKVHLKNEFKSHISPSSDCIHHCTQFALSEKECDHVHNASCQLCETMYHVKLEIADLVKRTTFNSTQDKEETNHDFELAIEKIWAWRDHSIRTVNQDLCRENIIQNLQEHEVMIIADWAMKYLPQTFRETQSEWFGKQGISWHMICGILCQAQSTTEDKEDQKNVEIVSIVHLVEEGKQGWHLVSQIFSNAFKVLKSIHPHLRDAYIRSDNAGCYHSLPMLSFLWKFRNELPLVVKQYDFSEAQSGKDLCDSRTGSCRLHMLNYINEGHDITNTLQMKEALESHGGIRNTYVSIVSPTSPIDTQPILCGQLKNFQISKYNNFSFEDEGLRAYKAYGIGGELINASDISRISEQLSLADEKLVFSDPKQPDFKAAYIRGSTTRDNFSCIEPDCIRVFKKENQLIHHLAVGKHVYDDENLDNLKDRSMRIWSSQCQELQLNQPVSCYGVEISESNFFAECPGYALKKRKKAVRFSPKVKNYLSVLYNHGEESGKKPSPFTISKQMRCETDVDGNCLFSPAEWLSHQQIRSFFGSLCMKKQREAERSGKSPDIKKDDNLEEDEDLQNIISDLVAHEHQSLLSNIVKELTF